MGIRLVKTLEGGEILAEPVITEENQILISKGTILKTEYLDLISFLGIDTVCIEDPYEVYEVSHPIMDRQKKEYYIAKIRGILECHTYHLKSSLKQMKTLARNIVDEILLERENSVVDNIVIDVEERYGNLYEHTFMVTVFSVMVGQKLSLKKEVLYEMALGCLLHDLGIRYITVPYINDDIENRPVSDIFEFKKHTILAYSVLEGEKWLSDLAKKMILFHHERKDGSGFPLRRKTKEIEIAILSVCDVFDSMISGVECRRVGVQQALEYLVEASSVLFEWKVVRIIQKMVARYPVGTKVKLNTGEKGIVISQTTDATHPVVGILDKEENLTEISYALNENKKISILQIEY